MPRYAKFMKELVTKKRGLDFETIEVSHSCSAIMTKELIKRTEYPGAFTIPCTISMLQFPKDLCDLGANINLMPYEIYKQLGLGEPKVNRFIFPADFVILDYEIDAEIPIILGSPILAIGRALVDVESGKLKFWVNKDEVTFNICKSMKHPSDIHMVSTDEVINEAVASVLSDPARRWQLQTEGSEFGVGECTSHTSSTTGGKLRGLDSERWPKRAKFGGRNTLRQNFIWSSSLMRLTSATCTWSKSSMLTGRQSRSHFVKVWGIDVTLTLAILNDIVGTITNTDPLSMVKLTKHIAKRFHQYLHYVHMSKEAQLNIGAMLKSTMRKARVHKGHNYSFGGLPGKSWDYTAPFFPAPVDLIMAHMYELEMLRHQNKCLASIEERLGEVERRYPLNVLTKVFLGISLEFHELMDNDVPTDEERMRTGSDVDSDSDTEEVTQYRLVMRPRAEKP
ncbi:hypothetical protein H5410_064554 [Solanum commersonii]|uniref:Uncharacterized protein n=1 Tax=Solanum commersonii TaxID=4109 RepID=A0A9J5VZC3_SOLCO|nr:hypothetical protein H5410_064554 [Solanum commersonii]